MVTLRNEVKLLPFLMDHPHSPLLYGTQCTVCYGWVDDPRHIRFGRLVRVVRRR